MALMANGVEPVEEGGVVIDVTTFAGMMAVITAIVTQVAKVIPFINEHKWAKILCSVMVGVVATVACWGLGIADFISDVTWWQAIITGAAAGLSGCGFYDVIKAIWSLVEPDKNNEEA